MSVDQESLKRVLMHIKGQARGFKKDALMSRLKPGMDSPPDVPVMGEEEPDPMDPAEPTEVAMGETGGMDVSAGDKDADAAAKLEAIRKLIGSV